MNSFDLVGIHMNYYEFVSVLQRPRPQARGAMQGAPCDAQPTRDRAPSSGRLRWLGFALGFDLGFYLDF